MAQVSQEMIAIQAEDHYVRVHTDSGSELVPMRFAEAVEELALAHGFRLHRSWWAAAEAIESVRWSRGGGEARLSGDFSAGEPELRRRPEAGRAAVRRGWLSE